jgi:transposase-like protein
MASTHRPNSLPPVRCEHFKAEPISTTIGKQLPDGRWRYRRSYRCPDCGESFIEQHTQTTPHRFTDRELKELRAKVDAVYRNVEALGTAAQAEFYARAFNGS